SFPRFGFSSWKIKRAIIELDHVAFVDQPAQIGYKREFAWLYIFGCNIANQLLKKVFAIDHCCSCQRFENRIHRWRDASLFVNKGPCSDRRDKQHPAARAKNVEPILSKSSSQLLHHTRGRARFPHPSILNRPIEYLVRQTATHDSSYRRY